MKLARTAIAAALLLFGDAARAQNDDPLAQPAAAARSISADPTSGASTNSDRLVGNNEFTGQLQVRYGLDLPSFISQRLRWLSIDYTGGEADDVLGRGWRLSLPKVERGSLRGIDFAGQDFVGRLNGSGGELVAMPDGTYRFRREGDFIRWSSTGQGAALIWIASAPDGTRYWFGQGDSTNRDPDDPERVSAWLLSSVEDPNGYRTNLGYRRVDGVALLTDVTFSPPSGTALFRIKLEYVDRSVPYDAFGSGHRVRRSSLLHSITLLDAAGDTVQGLAFEYLTGGGRSVLTNLWGTGYQAAERRRLAHFDYAEGDLSTTATPWASSAGASTPLSKECFEGDFNSDGRTDLSCHEGSGTWRTRLSTGSGFSEAQWTGGAVAASPVTNQCVAGDFTGDSRTDLACHAGSGTWNVAVSSGRGWTLATWANGPAGGTPLAGSCLSGDLTGDGRTDLACHTGGGTWSVGISSGSGFTAATWSGGPIPSSEMWKGCFSGEFNGDGRTDLACHSGSGAWSVGLPGGNGWAVATWNGGPSPAGEAGDNCLVADPNGDGLSDLLCHAGSGLWYVALSSGRSFVMQTWAAGPAPAGQAAQQCTSGDFDGDSLSDMACLVANQLALSYSRGASWSAASQSAAPAGLARLDELCRSRDFAGLSAEALLCLVNGGFETLLKPSGFAGLLSQITNELGGKLSFAYSSSAETSDVQLPFAIPVLRSQTIDTGRVSGTTSFSYAGGRYHPRAREFRGFERVSVTQPRSAQGAALRIETEYHQGDRLEPGDAQNPEVEFAHTLGKPRMDSLAEINGQMFERRRFTYHPPASSGPSLTPLKAEAVERCGPRGCVGPHRVEYEYDDFGNMTRRLDFGDASTAADDRELIITYLNDPAAWRLGLVETVLKRAPGAAPPLEFSRYEYGSRPAACSASSVDDPSRRRLSRITHGGADHRTVSSFGYDRFGNLACSQSGDNRPSLFVYDQSGTFLVRQTSPAGHSTVLNYYGVTSPSGAGAAPGRLRSITSPNNVVEQYAYDAFGRISQKTFGDGSSHTWGYSDRTEASPASVTVAFPLGVSETKYLDGFGNVIQSSTSWPGQPAIREDFEYDFANRLARHVYPRIEGQAPVFATQYFYDALGRRTSVREQDGRTSFACYDALRQIVINASGRQQIILSSIRGEIEEVQELDAPAGACTSGGNIYAQVRAEYDAAGRVARRMHGSMLQTSYDYATSGALISEDDADRGTTRFAYGTAGQLLERHNGDGRSVHFTYDPAGRLVQKDLGTRKAIGRGDYIFSYDAAVAHGRGRLRSIKSAFDQTRYDYDALGRLRQSIKSISGQRYRVETQFDALNRPVTESYPNNLILTYTYDGLRLRSISGNQGFSVRMSDYTPLGEARQTALGPTILRRSFNGDQGSRCQMPNHRLCDLRLSSAADETLLSRKYGYDTAGNVTTISAVSNASPADPTSVPASVDLVFGYDLQDRLASANLSAGNVTYRQSSRGQPNLEVGGVPQLGYSTDRLSAATHAPRTAFGDELSYDGAGRLRRLGSATYEWDPDGRLVSAETGQGAVTFDYDADGNLVRETRGREVIVHVNDALRCSASGCSLTVSANRRPVGVIDRQGSRYLVLEQNDSVLQLLDQGGSLVRRTEYFPYGEEVRPGAVGTRKYLGAYFSPESETYLLGRRHYSARLMQFISPDPIDGEAWSFQSGNRYAYALNNPVNRRDISGLGSERYSLLGENKGERSYLGGEKYKEYFERRAEWAGNQAERIGRGERIESFREYRERVGEPVRESRYHLIEPERIRSMGFSREIYDPPIEVAAFSPLDLIPTAWIGRVGLKAYSVIAANRQLIAKIETLVGDAVVKNGVANVSKEAAEAFIAEELANAGRVGTYRGVSRTTEGGAFVGVREVSKSGSPAIDINIPGYDRIRKIHFPSDD